MVGQLIAPEEVRDAIALDGPQTVRDLADDLAVSRTTVRRCLKALQDRDQVVGLGLVGRNYYLWSLTTEGARASRENEPL